MKKAANKIKKITLKKDNTFNWFKVVGPCGKKQGYKIANVIIAGKTKPGYGGGVCQVATTMYGCSRKLKMKKIESCLLCGQCKSRCPYGLDTPELLKKNYEDYKTFL